MNIQKQYFICKINGNVIPLEDFIKRHIVRNNKSSRQGSCFIVNVSFGLLIVFIIIFVWIIRLYTIFPQKIVTNPLFSIIK